MADPSTTDTRHTASSQHWMYATIIEDGDLMYGGKPLSAWYEEERRRQRVSLADSLEQDRRGRSRERHAMAVHHDGSHKKHHHH